MGRKPASAKQLAAREKFKALVQGKKAAADAKKAGTSDTVSVSEKVETSGSGIYIAIAVIVIAGLAYWYFTREKKP